MAESKQMSAIARERVDDLTARNAEPTWLKNARLSAWEAYLQTPLPTQRDESWQRTNITDLDLSSLYSTDFSSAKTASQSAPHWARKQLEHFSRPAGCLAQSESGIYVDMAHDLTAQGVIFCDLAKAIKEHSSKIEPYIKAPFAADDSKFVLMNKSLFNCGLLLYVPANLEIMAPFLSFLSLGNETSDTSGKAIFPRIFVIVGAGSKVSLIHSTISGTDGTPYLHASLNHFHIQDGASLSFLGIEDIGHNVYSINHTGNVVGKDSELKALSVALGGRQIKSDIKTCLEASGATSEILGLVFGSGKECFSFNTIQEHNAPDTRSDINFRVALNESSTSIYQGIIKIAKSAQRTNAYQSNKNLLLGSQAKADSIPKLEILADDVKCSHGATVGPVDYEQVFYLMSRGLPEKVAEELIVLGFFHSVLERFPVKEAVGWLSETISKRIVTGKRINPNQ